MAKIREKDRRAVLDALSGGVTPRRGIAHIQVGRVDETKAILKDIETIQSGGASCRIIASSYGSGKALPLTTKILTPNGWVENGSLKEGNEVYTRKGKITKITGIFDQGEMEEYLIELADGRTTIAAGTHLWFVNVGTQNDGEWTYEEKVMTTGQILQALDTDNDNNIELRMPYVDMRLFPKNLLATLASDGYLCAPDENILFGVQIASIKKTGNSQPMRCISVADKDASYVIEDFVPSHNTFMLTLSKTIALNANMLVMQCDFSPDRRLYSSSGQANALYRELVRSLSTQLCPDGGAIEELLDAVDEKIESGDKEFLSSLRRLPYGFDALTVCNKWHISKNPSTDAEKRDAMMLQDACLRWFAGENTAEHKRLLGVKQSIGDDGAYDALKMIAMLGHYAGYNGLFVELDECVNLYKINNSTSRDRNYEQILRIFNECRQGDASYIGFLLAGTPEFVMDPRRGLFSYDALRSRLVSGDYSQTTEKININSPIINLSPLTPEDLLVLLGNITNVEAMGERENWLIEDPQMQEFLKRYCDALGSDYYRTPREIIRSFVDLLQTLRDSNGETTFEQLLSRVKVEKPKKESGLGAAVKISSSDDGDTEEDDDENFGF